MEACGIEGNYRNTCELVMKVVRENKDSLLAVFFDQICQGVAIWNPTYQPGISTQRDYTKPCNLEILFFSDIVIMKKSID